MSRSMLMELAGLVENGCVECVGNASCVLNSCTTLKIVRKYASFDDAWLEDASILLY